jgi:hypothetical protein
MKIAYLAAPYGGSFERLGYAQDWVRFFFRQFPDLVIAAPWVTLVSVVADTPVNRQVGLAWNAELIKRCDAMIIVGEAEAVERSKGVAIEKELAERLDMFVVRVPFRRAPDLVREDILRLREDLRRYGLIAAEPLRGARC